MSVTPITVSDGQSTSCGWAVICDGCGNGLQFCLDGNPDYEIDTEFFAGSGAAARSATNRGWSLEPPEGRDGAYCPDCVAADSVVEALDTRIFQAGQRARCEGKALRENPHRVRSNASMWAKGWCDQERNP